MMVQASIGPGTRRFGDRILAEYLKADPCDDRRARELLLALGSGGFGGAYAARMAATAKRYSPVLEGNCVFAFDADASDISLAATELVASGSAFDAAAWTKGAVTVTANAGTHPTGGATADRVVVSSASPAVYQALSAIIGADMPPLTLTVHAKYESVQWIGIFGDNSAGSTARVAWFDVQNGAVGAVGSLYSGASIQSLGDGWYVLTATRNSGLNSPYLGVMLSTTNTSQTSPTASSSVLLYGASATQQRVTSFRNLSTGVLVEQTTGGLRGGLATNWDASGRRTLLFSGGQWYASTESALVAACASNNPLTVYYTVGAPSAPDEGTAVFGSFDGTSPSTSMRYYGLNTGGSGQYLYQTIDGSGASISSATTSSSTLSGNHQLSWKHSGNDITLRFDRAAMAIVGPTNNPVSNAPTRAGIGGRLDSTPSNFLGSVPAQHKLRAIFVFSVTHDAAATARVEAFLASHGGL